jgi:hypothetical protein
MTKNWKKYTAEKNIKFFWDQKQFTYAQGSIKDVQVAKEAFSSQKRTSSTSKHEISYFFLLLWAIFALLDPDPDSEYGSGSTDLIESGSNSDPDTDPQPWFRLAPFRELSFVICHFVNCSSSLYALLYSRLCVIAASCFSRVCIY